MPGTVVRDALAPDLLSGVTTTTAAGANQAGTAWEAGWPEEVQFSLVITAKSGTTPLTVIDIQGSESATFADDVVTLGTITVLDPTVPATHGFSTHVNSRYVRAVSTVTGTTGTVTATLVPVLAHDRRTRSVNPTAKVLV